jgi:hypothetical protein
MRIKMKNLIFAVLFALPLFAHAEAPLCQHYSQSELEGMSMDQLNQLEARFTVIVYGDSYTAQVDSLNCSTESGRVNDVINGRIHELLATVKAQSEANGAVAKEQQYETTVEGRIFKKMKDSCDVLAFKYKFNQPDIFGQTDCLGYIQDSLAANNCNPNSDNTPEDIACVGRTFEDVKKLIAADLECNKKYPTPASDETWGDLRDDPDLNRDACTTANYKKFSEVANAARAKWKALGYYPNN